MLALFVFTASCEWRASIEGEEVTWELGLRQAQPERVWGVKGNQEGMSKPPSPAQAEPVEARAPLLRVWVKQSVAASAMQAPRQHCTIDMLR
jgi:hypothetical protein